MGGPHEPLHRAEREVGSALFPARRRGYSCRGGAPIAGTSPRHQITAMLLDALRARKDAIHAACRQYGARRIRVFGSVARGEERPDSDIDFLVDFPRGYDLFAQRLPLAERLTQITGRRLDLIPEHELSRHLREAVLKEAVEL